MSVLLVPCAAAPPDQPEPPVRLKKKAKPATEEPALEKNPKTAPEKSKSRDDELRPKKRPDKLRLPGTKEKDDDPEEDRKEPEQDSKEIMARINKNMRTAEDRLAQKDASEATRQVQRDIVKDLNALIEQTRRQQQQQRADRMSGSQQRRQRSPDPRESQQRADAQRQQEQDAMANSGMGGGRSKDGRSKIADLYKDIWGHLPETLRQEMDSYSRERFMAKYNDLLKQYYSTIAEKGRQKGE